MTELWPQSSHLENGDGNYCGSPQGWGGATRVPGWPSVSARPAAPELGTERVLERLLRVGSPPSSSAAARKRTGHSGQRNSGPGSASRPPGTPNCWAHTPVLNSRSGGRGTRTPRTMSQMRSGMLLTPSLSVPVPHSYGAESLAACGAGGWACHLPCPPLTQG